MACYRPITAWKLAGGGVTFVERGDVVAQIALPCRGCIGCRLARASMWAVRITHESYLHARNCWLTLTYETPPAGNTLVKRDVQLFMKRLRKHAHNSDGSKIRFFACGEYGDQNGRPHYHICIFGFDFDDKKLHNKTKYGVIYTSPTLTKLWGKGHAVVAALTPESAAYTARYSVKKINGDLAESHYRYVDPETGVCSARLPEFGLMSSIPGLGAGFFDKYHGDLMAHDYAHVGGRKHSMPPYYDKLQKRRDPELLEELKFARTVRAKTHHTDNTPERLAVRETVHQAKANLNKRNI